ncbi:MAG: hypothetical protein AB7T06_19590 [Kofleriaceae bacterium]
MKEDKRLRDEITDSTRRNRERRPVLQTELLQLLEKLTLLGTPLPGVPECLEKWPLWRLEVEAVISTRVDTVGNLALALGWDAFNLMVALYRAIATMTLRMVRPHHRILVREAEHRASEVVNAWTRFDRALEHAEGPLLQLRRKELVHSYLGRPSWEFVDEPSHNRLEKMHRWLLEFEDCMSAISVDLDAPIDPSPAHPASREEENLQRQIIDNPEDDSLRLRFAELAVSRGSARGHFVLDQFLATRTGWDKYFAYRRVQQRIVLHPEWSAPLLSLGATEVKFERGFVFEISIDVDSFVANAGELFTLAPITNVRIRGGLVGKGAALASVPQLTRLRLLDLVEQGVTDADVIAIVNSGHLAKLWELNLHQNPVTAAGVEAIAAATHAMPELTCVNLQLTRAVDPCDRFEYYNETQGHYVPTPEGQALESKYGPLPWLHAELTVLDIPVPRQRNHRAGR